MATPDTLRVLANPYGYVDHLGRLAGACPQEIAPGSAPKRRYVGAKIAATVTFTPKGEDIRSPEQDTQFVFATEPVEVPNTQYYRDRVRDGDIVAVDEASSRKSGVAYVDPVERLFEARAKAIAEWTALYGEAPAFVANEGNQ